MHTLYIVKAKVLHSQSILHNLVYVVSEEDKVLLKDYWNQFFFIMNDMHKKV